MLQPEIVRRPSFIIYSYMRDGGYVYLHIPKRSTEQCGITSGTMFLGYIDNSNKLVMEQIRNEKLGNSTAKK